MSLLGFKARNHPQQKATDFVDDRETDPEMFSRLHERFHFTLDVAASPHNAKLENYYTAEDDGLSQPWTGRVWCNPPYSDVRPWVEKAWSEWRRPWSPERASVIALLLPANRTEQGWWQDLVEPHRDQPDSDLKTEFIRGRTRFIAAGDDQIKPNAGPPFGCVLLIWS